MAKTFSDWVAALTPAWLLNGLEPNFTVTSGSRVLAESLARRFTTMRGTLIGPPGSPEANQGYDVRQHLNDRFDNEKLARLAGTLSSEAKKDERVQSATTSLSFDFATQQLSIKISGVSSSGPFALTLGIGALTVDILDGTSELNPLPVGTDFGTDITTYPAGGPPPLPDDGVAYSWGERFMRTVIGLPIDLLIDATKLAVKCRLLQVCPDDALAYHAQERMIDGVPGETPAALRLRLQAAWSTWSKGGTGGAIETALGLFGATNVQIYAQQITGSPTKVDKLVFDSNDNWSRFWIFVYPPHPWTPMVASDSLTASDDLVAGISGMNQVQLAAIRKQVHRWRSAHGLASEMFVVFDNTLTPEDIITMVADPSTLDDSRFVDVPLGQFAGWGFTQFAGDINAGYYEPFGNPF